MKTIFKTIGRILAKLSMVLGFVVLILAVIGLFSFYDLIAGDDEAQPLPDQFTLFYEFKGAIPDIHQSAGLFDHWVPRDVDLVQFIKTIEAAKTDPRVTGLAVNIHDGDYTLSQIQSIRNAIIDFGQSDKTTIAYSSAYGDFSNGLGEYWLASAFDEIWVQPVGLVSINGLYIEQPYMRDALDKIGIEPQIIQRKSYKTGPETYTRDGMSDEATETLVDISQGMMDVILNDIARARNLPLTDVAAAVNLAPLTSGDAYKMGLVDKVGYTDEIEKNLKGKGAAKQKFVSLKRYAGDVLAIDNDGSAQVAVVLVEGMILDNPMVTAGADLRSMFMPSDIADASKIAASLMNAADDRNIKVIVMRVDSPGGSPTASETIRRAVAYARAKGKYVIVSMGDTAASGGYWVAVNANQIIASNLTLTGSIGVYGGKMDLSELWNKLGLNWDAVAVGQNASMWSFNKGYSEQEQARLNAIMDDVYNGFVKRVASGRNMDADAVEEVAQGRVWLGKAARDNNLVDLNGGFEFALKRAAGEAGGLDWQTMPLLVLPIAENPLNDILNLIGIQKQAITPLKLPGALIPYMVPQAIVARPGLNVQF